MNGSPQGLTTIALDKWHECINEISDICNTTIIYDSMSKEEIIDLFHRTLARIYELADYPPDDRVAKLD